MIREVCDATWCMVLGDRRRASIRVASSANSLKIQILKDQLKRFTVFPYHFSTKVGFPFYWHATKQPIEENNRSIIHLMWSTL